MLDNIYLENLLVIDIETVPGCESFEQLSDEMQILWELKEGRNRPDGSTPPDYYFEKAGILAEFGRIICISTGFFKKDKTTGEWQFRIKSFSDLNEKQVLSDFSNLLGKYFNKPEKHILAGHNIREFDVPYLCRRLLINGMKLPTLLDVSGRKPWEVNWVDSMQLWKFGDYKNYVSLRLLAALFKVPTPKGDIDGSDVARVFYKENDLKRIVEYCQRDVLTVARIVLKFKGLDDLPAHQVFILE